MLPFDTYPGGGKELMPGVGGPRARQGYIHEFVKMTGQRCCAYCGMNLWENFNVWRTAVAYDHVVPVSVCKALGIARQWREDYSNGVIACSSCNSFDNQFRLPASFAGRTYTTLTEFYQLRDEVFLLRKERILILIEAERVFFETNYGAEQGWQEVTIDSMTAADEEESGCSPIPDEVAVQQTCALASPIENYSGFQGL